MKYTPPKDISVEKNVLGCFLLEAIPEHIQELSPDLFFSKKNRTIVQAIIALNNEGKPYDIVAVSAYLRDKDKMNDAGGEIYVTSLLSDIVTTASIEYYIDILKKLALRRAMMRSSEALWQAGLEGEDDQLENILENMIDQLSSNGKNNIKDINEIIKEKRGELLAKFEGKSGIPSGLRNLDEKIKGFLPGAYIIGGRPGMGKTSLMLSMALHQAKQGHKVGVVSLEMSRERLLEWILDYEMEMDHQKTPAGTTLEAWQTQIQVTLDDISRLKEYISIDDTPYAHVEDVVKTCYNLKYKRDIDILYVDYVQLLGAKTGKDSTREREVAEVSRKLTALKKRLEIPIVLLAQLNREMKNAKDNRPKLHHLRESGALEQEADVVMMLFDPKQSGEEDALHELHIVKNRHGPITSIKNPIKLYFNKPAKKFSDGIV